MEAVRGRGAARLIAGLTISRVPLACVFAVALLFWEGGRSELATCAALLALVEATDVLDGLLARRLRVESEFGAMLDPLSDSISRLTIYWALAAEGLVLLVVPLVMAARDITVGYCRLWLVRQGRSVRARPSGKLKAVVQGAASIGILLQPLYEARAGAWTKPGWSYLVIAVTVLSGVDYVRDALTRRR